MNPADKVILALMAIAAVALVVSLGSLLRDRFRAARRLSAITSDRETQS